MFFFFNDTATTEIYTLSLHDALPICAIVDAKCPIDQQDIEPEKAKHRPCSEQQKRRPGHEADARSMAGVWLFRARCPRSEEHTSELQSPDHLVFRLLLEKKKRQ